MAWKTVPAEPICKLSALICKKILAIWCTMCYIVAMTELKWEHKEKQCSICRSPNRKWVERDYIDWLSPEEVLERHPDIDQSDFFPHFNSTGLMDQKFLDKKRMCLAVIVRGIGLLDHLAAKAPAEVVKLLPKMIQLAAELNGEIKRSAEMKNEIHYHIDQQKRDERLRAGLERFGGRLEERINGKA